MRLAKFLSHAGVASRRAAEEIVRSGRVALDGTIITDPARDVGDADDVTLDGKRITGEPARVVYAVNKPAGVVSTARDPQRRPTVVSLVHSDVRLYPVGRLDIDTTGLILLTNDGELANRLTHPRYEVEKTYRVVVGRAPVREAAINALRAGVLLDDGRTAPAKIRRLSADTLEITIHEGRKRQIKRMCEHVGHPVRRLERIRFGSLELGTLKSGASRRLTNAEVRRLAALSAAEAGDRRSAGGSSAGSARAPARSPSPGARRRAAGP